jgi:hypothetical protein
VKASQGVWQQKLMEQLDNGCVSCGPVSKVTAHGTVNCLGKRIYVSHVLVSDRIRASR